MREFSIVLSFLNNPKYFAFGIIAGLVIVWLYRKPKPIWKEQSHPTDFDIVYLILGIIIFLISLIAMIGWLFETLL